MSIMKNIQNKEMKKHISYRIGLLICGLLWLLSACSKVDYTRIDDPAYLRVFNNFNYALNMAEKDNKVPFLCMIINPDLDATGKPVGGEIIGDFLNVREPYAPPYPSHIGSSTSASNPEYPGKENVLVGPILNGFDLSSWAQVPAGKIHIMFMYRPKNEVPYFQLESRLQGDVMLDTVLQLESKEVYILHLLQRDFKAKKNGMVLRKENFHKLSLSDSLLYVNFYNYSAEGFWQADASLKPSSNLTTLFQQGIRDKMDVFLTLYKDQEDAATNMDFYFDYLPGYKGKYLTSLVRNSQSDAVSPYLSFPLWANASDDGIRTKIWQRFDFFTPGMDPSTNPFGRNDLDTKSNWAALNCLLNGKVAASRDNGATLPNMIVNIHSGMNNPQSFATVNTIEIVNGAVYLTTIQRKYPSPIY